MKEDSVMTDTTITTKLTADQRRDEAARVWAELATMASDARPISEEDIANAVAAFSVCPNPRAHLGAMAAATLDMIDDDDDDTQLAIGRLRRRVATALPENGPAVVAVDPSTAARAAADRLIALHASLIEAAAIAVDRYLAIAPADHTAGEYSLTAAESRAFEKVNDLLATEKSPRSSTGKPSADRISQPSDYVPGAVFAFGTHTLKVTSATLSADGTKVAELIGELDGQPFTGSPSGAATQVAGSSRNGYASWAIQA